MSNSILCIGEILWDALPEGLFLGGAPFNVACHLRTLKEDVFFASRVGDDRLGKEALRRMRARGLKTSLIQIDDSLPTGFVRVELSETGDPDYEILDPVAWDAIACTESLRQRAEHVDALVYGSLAQRAPITRRTIRKLCQIDGLRVFDVNVRPPFADRSVIEHSLEAADVIKLNDEELRRLRSWFDLQSQTEIALAGLASQFNCRAACVTEGPGGAHLWENGVYWHHPGYTVEVEDTVGAGDAFLSVLLSGLLEKLEGDRILEWANRLGAFVASRPGAFPDYSVDALDDVAELPLPSPTGPS